MNASARAGVMSGMKKEDSLSDLQLRYCKTTATPSKVSDRRSDASSIKTFPLAELWSDFSYFKVSADCGGEDKT